MFWNNFLNKVQPFLQIWLFCILEKITPMKRGWIILIFRSKFNFLFFISKKTFYDKVSFIFDLKRHIRELFEINFTSCLGHFNKNILSWFLKVLKSSQLLEIGVCSKNHKKSLFAEFLHSQVFFGTIFCCCCSLLLER